MTRTRIGLVTAVLAAAAAAASLPPAGPEDAAAQERSRSSPRARASDLYEFRWLEVRTKADGGDLRASHFAEGAEGLRASGDAGRFGTLVLPDPEKAITRLRQEFAPAAVLERARLVGPLNEGPLTYTSGTRIPVETRTDHGGTDIVRTRYEQTGADLVLERSEGSVRYEVQLTAPTGRDAITDELVLSTRHWRATSPLAQGHTLILAAHIRHDPWLGEPLGGHPEGETVAESGRLWVVMITRTGVEHR